MPLSVKSAIPPISLTGQDVQIEQREWCYRGYVQVEKLQLRHRLFNSQGWSNSLSRELIHRREAAGCLLYNATQQQFALIEQFRIGAVDDAHSPWQLEVVAGVLDGDETPQACIQRECIEEAGCHIHSLKTIGAFYLSAGSCSEYFHLYAAEADFPANGSVFGLSSEGENIRLHVFDYAILSTLLSSGRLQNAAVILALQWLQLQLAHHAHLE